MTNKSHPDTIHRSNPDTRHRSKLDVEIRFNMHGITHRVRAAAGDDYEKAVGRYILEEAGVTAQIEECRDEEEAADSSR